MLQIENKIENFRHIVFENNNTLEEKRLKDAKEMLEKDR